MDRISSAIFLTLTCEVLSALGAPLAGQEEPAIEVLRERAAAGEAEAQNELSLALYWGDGVERDDAESFAWAKKAADQGFPNAFTNLGWHYYHGRGAETDLPEAVRLFRRGIAKDDAHAYYSLGWCHEKGIGVEQDPDEAFRCYRAAAERGHATGQVATGFCYETGIGTDEDAGAARSWYEKAAAAEHMGGMASFGMCLLNGYGGPTDVERGLALLRGADEREDGWAPVLLGDIHRLGRHGVPLDLDAAEAAYARAAERGHETGVARLRRFFPGEHLDLVDQAYDLSLRFEVGRPQLIEIDDSAKLVADIDAAGVRKRIEESIVQERRFVEEFAENGEDWRATRQVCRWQKTVDGKPRDPEFEGAVLEIGVRDGVPHVELGSGRQVKQDSLQRLLKQVPAAGVDLPLPTMVKIGETVEVDASNLLPFLFDLEGEVQSARAQLTFEAFDADTRRARLAGTAAAREKIPAMAEATAEYEFDLSVEVDLSQRTITALTAKGTATLTGPGGLVEVAGTSDFTLQLRTATGEPAQRVAAEKVKFRDVERELEAAYVSLTLPSHFMEIDEAEGATLVSCLETDRAVTIRLKSFDAQGAKPTAVIVEAEKAILAEVDEIGRSKAARCALGNGRHVEYLNESGEHVDFEVFPLGKQRVLRLIVVGSIEAKKTLSRDISRMKDSLEPLGG